VWTPFANARGQFFSYENNRDPLSNALIPDDAGIRGVVAGGLMYSYPFVAHTSFGSHVIEPTAQLIVRQNQVNQTRLPDEDAKSLVFDDTLLFDIDKFSGYDRFETGTRANVGVQYTFQGAGGTYGRAVFGQSFQLAGANPYATPGFDPTGVTLNYDPASGLQTNRSDYVAGVYLSPFTGVSLISQSRFDEKDWSMHRQDTGLNVIYGPVTGSLAYTFSTFEPLTGLPTTQREIMPALGLKLTTNWSALGSLRYDMETRQRIQDTLTLKYADECFVLTASYIETFVENAALDLKPDRTIMLRFELKHLGDFSYKSGLMTEQNLGPKL
jgi:LPS-assembly protein